MTHLKTFPRGGIRPPLHKDATSADPIRNAAVPSLAVIPMRQYPGEPALCLVRPGDEVSEGMIIGRAGADGSAPVHSSIPGRVVEIRDVPTAEGMGSQAVLIELGGEFDRSARGRRPGDWQALGELAIMERIAAAGVVGLGGSFTPAAARLAAARAAGAEVLVANGVESEPYLSADHRLLVEKSREIHEALGIVRRIVPVRRVILAVSEESLDAAALYREVFAAGGDGFEVEVLQARYPQGERSALLSALHLAPSALVVNVATLFALWEAVALEKPLTERVVTVAGSAVGRPRNLKVRIGTLLTDLFEECGGLAADCGQVIVGGPMTGRAQADLHVPVTKGVDGVIALSRKDTRVLRVPCIRCGGCVDACPWGLWPVTLFRLIERGDLDRAVREGLMECTECGSCAYACPSRVPLVELLHRGKTIAAGKAARLG
jgi:Na+-translocating ferredoxin:NAD+ oxidoreductase subunit C